jgi:hypothetical protein
MPIVVEKNPAIGGSAAATPGFQKAIHPLKFRAMETA